MDSKPLSRKRLWAIRATTACLVVCVCIIFCELAGGIVGVILYNETSVAKLYERDLANTFVSANEGDYAQTLTPHPYLAYVYKNTNNVGLYGVDYPLEHQDTQFTILVTGGSVASQFVLSGHLERLLNDKYAGEKPYVVLNGGGGAWAQPQQMILLSQHVHVIDAVITIDGFNEYPKMAGWHARLERPATNFDTVNPLSEDGGYENLVSLWLLARFRKMGQTNIVARHSRSMWLTAHLAQASLRRSMAETTTKPMYALPDEWPQERAYAYNLNLYKGYIRQMHAISNLNAVKNSYFLQPVPVIDKPLSEAEQAFDHADYADVYRRMTDDLLTLQDDGIAIHSLLSIYADHDETIYTDPIHATDDGYRIMAEAVATQIAADWGLAVRDQATLTPGRE